MEVEGFRFERNTPALFSETIQSKSTRGGTFLSVSTAEFVSYLWPPGLPEEDLDEESILGVG